MYLAVLTCNEGQHSLLPLIEELKGEKPSPYCERVLSDADSCRMYKSLVAESDLVKRRRKAQRIAQATSEGQLITEEGVTYGYGEF